MNRRKMLRDRDAGIRVEYWHPRWTWAAMAPNGEVSGNGGYLFPWTARRAARKWLRSVRRNWA